MEGWAAGEGAGKERGEAVTEMAADLGVEEALAGSVAVVEGVSERVANSGMVVVAMVGSWGAMVGSEERKGGGSAAAKGLAAARVVAREATAEATAVVTEVALEKGTVVAARAAAWEAAEGEVGAAAEAASLGAASEAVETAVGWGAGNWAAGAEGALEVA